MICFLDSILVVLGPNNHGDHLDVESTQLFVFYCAYFFKDLVIVFVSLFVLMVGPIDPLGGSGKYYSINFVILSTFIPQIMLPLLLSKLNSLVMKILFVDEFHD